MPGPATGEVTAHPSFALALGAGGARGLAHIVALETLDELGVRPKFIAGCSIGAMMAAAYASGVTGAEIRDHVQTVLGNRIDTMRRLMARGSGGIGNFLDIRPFRAPIIQGEALLDVILPAGTGTEFTTLGIPTIINATDFYSRTEYVFDEGPLRPAIAASTALPALFAPQVVGSRVLVDGGLVNPLPVDHLHARAEITVAIDVTGNRTETGTGSPSTMDAMYGAFQIMQHVIIEHRLRQHPVDVLIKPAVARFRVLDFFKAAEVLQAAEPIREELKFKLDKVFNRAGP